MVMDGGREQTMGEFRKKAREMSMKVRQTESYSPWQNAAEGSIREVKQAAGLRMMKMKAPKKLWDHCLELQGFIKSHTTNDHFELQGQIPETVLSGQTADISPFALFGFYNWFKFWDVTASYPDDKECVGR